jgi:Putative ABC exporter
MNRALFQLLWLNNKAVFRRTLRGVKTWRGALLLAFTLGFFALMIGPQVALFLTMHGRPEALAMSTVFEPVAPLGLFAFTLLLVFTSAGEVAVAFSPAEVDLLFAAPFTRRELLLYKLGKTAVALVVVSLFVSLTMLMNFPSWPAAFVGIALALTMTQLAGMASALAGQIVGESAYTRARQLTLIVVAIVALWGLSPIIGMVAAQRPGGLMALLRESPVFRVLLAPFVVFAKTIFAREWFPDLVGWGAGALAIDAALLALVMRLDANYIETAAAVSQKVYERILRSKQGGGITMPVGANAGRLRLATLPWLAGAGPVAWRQLLIVFRTSRHMVIASMALVIMFCAIPLFAPAPTSGVQAASFVPLIGVGMTFYLTFIFSMQLPWAFRGDLDHIEVLKTLPVRPALLSAGELAGGTLMLTGIQLLLFIIVTIFTRADWLLMLLSGAFCLPLNGLVLALNNFLFLLYPVRHPGGATFDMQVFGKMMLFMMLQFLLLLPLLGIPAALGGGVAFLVGGSWPAFLITAWVLLAAEVVSLIFAVAWAFLRFDVSTETPA